MKVILQQNIANLGRIGDEVKVKAGFARNFLIPQDKAVVATQENSKLFELRREELEKQAAERITIAQQRAKSLQALNITISSKASEEGKLFGSVGPREIVDAIVSAGQDIKKPEITMPNGPIRVVGEHTIAIVLHTDVSFEMSLNIVADK